MLWLEYQMQMQHEKQDRAPVEHKISLRDEPPLLVWLRERFAAILFAVVLFGSLFFGMTMFLVRFWSANVPMKPPTEVGELP